MENELLSAKLLEMDGQFSKMRSSIQTCESLDPDRIHEALQALTAECSAREDTLRQSLERSRAQEAAALLEQYDTIEAVICQAKDSLGRQTPTPQGGEETAEQLTLLAEYKLDFAMLAADRALAVSMRAMEAQLQVQTKEGRRL